MLKKEMICIWRGIYLYAATCSITLRFLILSSFLFTRNLRIDKNYTLSIFILSGSIQFYSKFQFIMTCIYHKTMPFILSKYTHAYSFSHAFTLQIIYHIKYAFSHATNHLTIQFMRFKHTLLKMCLVYKSHLHSPSSLFHFVYAIHIHDGFRSVNPVLFMIR